MKRKFLNRVSILFGVIFAVMGLTSTSYAAEKIGIFEKILDASGSFAETTAAFDAALSESDLTLHGTHDIYVPDGIQSARVYILTSPAYLEAAKSESPNTASAQVLRVGIYTFGEGRKTYINMANPIAHAMVFYAGSDNYDGMISGAQAAAQEIKAVVAKVPGDQVSEQLAPTRKAKAYRKFNGDGPAKMMAKFRNWEESQHSIIEAGSGDFESVVSQVEELLKSSKDGGSDDSTGWDLLAKITINDNAVYFGISNEYTENKCVRINSDFRSAGKTDDAPYPGVDHVTALPLEILVVNDGKNTKVVHYGQMWRMQLYFWDSGYMAFAKNTLIPGIIFSSIDKTAKVDTGG